MATGKPGKNFGYAKYGYIFAIPFIVTFAIFSLYPLLYTMFIGFTDLSGLGASHPRILADPFENYNLVLNNNLFQTSLKNTFFIWFVNFIPQIVLALLFTAWLTSRNFRVRGQSVFKILFYMPNIITAATIAILFSQLFQRDGFGVVNSLLMNLGLIDAPIDFLIKKLNAQLIVAFIQFWMWYGYTMLILISGVKGLNPSMFESADIDGANGVQQFFLITLPNLRTIMLFVLVTSLIGGLNMFDIPHLFNNGNPDSATYTVSMFIQRRATSQGRYQYNIASAASMILFVIVGVLACILFFMMRDKDAIAKRKEEKELLRAYKLSGGK
ncbi:MAG: sugar ABC transporter permease [Oscillospiraceae bacterium]|nr:sugar ABC transporter permease [Oscillospiraceae bacterium]